MKKKLIIIISAIAVALAILLIIFIIPQTRISLPPKIKVGIWEDGVFSRKKGENWVGYDVQAATKILTELGYKVEFVETSYSEADQLLKNKKIDCYITSQKGNSQNAYTKSYCSVSQGIVYKGNLPIYSPEELSEYTIGIRGGMANKNYLLEYVAEEKITSYKTDSDLLAMLQSDVINICILDYYYIEEIMHTNLFAGYTSGILIDSREKLFATRANDNTLVNEINESIDERYKEEYFNSIKYSYKLDGFVV